MGALTIISLLGAATKAESAKSFRLRVVTFNVNGASTGTHLSKVLASHEELREADVVMLQEIETTGNSHGPRELAEKLGLDVAYAIARRGVWGTHGIAILSRQPLQDIEVLPLPRFDLGYRSRHRIAVSAAIEVGGKRLRLFNVHLDTRLTLDERIWQVEPVIRRAAAAGRAVVGGDFNTIRAVRWLLPWLPLPLWGWNQADGFEEFMHRQGLKKTLPNVGRTGPLGMELDALYRLGLRGTDYGTAAFPALSDHLALWADLHLSLGEEE